MISRPKGLRQTLEGVPKHLDAFLPLVRQFEAQPLQAEEKKKKRSFLVHLLQTKLQANKTHLKSGRMLNAQLKHTVHQGYYYALSTAIATSDSTRQCEKRHVTCDEGSRC